jgi:uncharacterized damage-inducible protein DinB
LPRPRAPWSADERSERPRAIVLDVTNLGVVSQGETVSPRPSEPTKSEPPGARRWADYLTWLREEIIVSVLSLSALEQHTSRVASGWTPIQLLSHVLHMEQRWFVWGFLGEAVEQPWGDWNMPEPWTADDSDETRVAARWHVGDDVTAEDLADRLRLVGRRTSAIILGHSMDDLAAAGGRFGQDPPTLEWICFHVLVEYARHAGHVDIAAELARG